VPCLDLGTDRGTCESFVSISALGDLEDFDLSKMPIAERPQ
jgi:hypothetical protein